MRRFIAIHIVVFAVLSPTYGQSSEDEVRAAVDALFDGMRAGDSTAVRAAFHESAMMGRALYDKDGKPAIRMGPIDRFVTAVGTPHNEVWDERIWNVQIHTDRNLASAWMDYAFYLGDQLHHCGVNSMQLFRDEAGWKIVYLLDTDHGLECTLPPAH